MSQAVAVLLALVPFAYLIRLVVLRTVDVPLGDEWGIVLRLDHWRAGTLSIMDFWGQHNEHRPLFPIALLLPLARLTDWDTRWEIGLTVGLGVAIFAVYCAYLRSAWRAHGGAPIWLVPVFAMLLFSPIQWENWLWGWQVTEMLCALASVWAACLAARGLVGARFFGATACAVVATYSFASGLLVWPVHAAGIVIAGGARRLTRLTIWTAAAGVTYATYFYQFQRPPDQPSMLLNFASLHAFAWYVHFVVMSLGCPIAGPHAGAATIAGVAVLVLFAALAFGLRSFRADPVYLFPLLIGLQAVLSAAVTGLGRSWLGVESALTSRYTTLAMPLWCATMSLAVLWRPPDLAPVRARALTAIKVVAIVAILAEGVLGTRAGVYAASGRSEILMFARRGLLTGTSDALLKQLMPNVEAIREWRRTAMRLHVTVFRASAQPSYPLPGTE
jgi:hypothetical protein